MLRKGCLVRQGETARAQHDRGVVFATTACGGSSTGLHPYSSARQPTAVESNRTVTKTQVPRWIISWQTKKLTSKCSCHIQLYFPLSTPSLHSITRSNLRKKGLAILAVASVTGAHRSRLFQLYWLLLMTSSFSKFQYDCAVVSVLYGNFQNRYEWYMCVCINACDLTVKSFSEHWFG